MAIDACSFMEVTSPSAPQVEIVSVIIYRHLTSEVITSANVGDVIDVAVTIKNNGTTTASIQVGVYVNGNMWYQFGHSQFGAGAIYTDKQYFTIAGEGDLTICAATL